MIKKCTCDHKSQDELHGKGNRVMNATAKAPPTYRCTVCGRVV